MWAPRLGGGTTTLFDGRSLVIWRANAPPVLTTSSIWYRMMIVSFIRSPLAGSSRILFLTNFLDSVGAATSEFTGVRAKEGNRMSRPNTSVQRRLHTRTDTHGSSCARETGENKVTSERTKRMNSDLPRLTGQSSVPGVGILPCTRDLDRALIPAPALRHILPSVALVHQGEPMESPDHTSF